MKDKDKIELNKPFKSNVKNKKYSVFVKDPKTNKIVKVNYGHTSYEDFLSHKDPERRKRYLARASKIRDKNGRLTKDDITSPNYHSMRHLWGYKG